MQFRQAEPEETAVLFRAGYKVWSRGRSLEQYCLDNGREDAYGTRYVIEAAGEIVSSAILLRLARLADKKTYGIGSVLTPPDFAGRGYATRLLIACLELVDREDAIVFLYSDIGPAFYARFGFRPLPDAFQRYHSTFMVRCPEAIWTQLILMLPQSLPDYF